MKRKTIVASLMICCLFVPSAFAFIGAISDPMAAIQRGILIAEAKIRTLQTVKLMMDTYNNYKTAKMMYEQAKAGYEQLSDPNTWDSLKKFAEKRFSNILDMEGDPYNSSLYRMASQLDEAADTYMKSLANTEVMIEKIDWLDDSIVKGLSTHRNVDGEQEGTPFIGNWSEGEKWSVDVNKRAQSAAKMKEAIRASVKAWGKDAEKLLPFVQMAFDEKERLDAETKDWARAAQTAFNAKLQAEADIKNATDETASKGASIKQQHASDQYSSMLKEKEVLDKKKQGWIDKWGPLVGTFYSYQEKLNEMTSTLGFANEMNSTFYESIGLVNMAENNAILLEYVEAYFFRLMVITLALALLWAGIQVHKGEGIIVPHEVILGFLGAVIFIAPRSPLAMHNIAKALAVSTDTLTLSFAGSVSNPGTVIMSTFGKSLFNDVQSIGGAMRAPKKNVVQKIMEVASDIFVEKIKFAFISAIGSLISLVGALTVIIILLLRNMLFWVLMVVSPVVIFLAPLSYGRKLIANWGRMLYGIILMGPITLIMLLICNSAMQHATGAFTASSYGAGAQSLITMNVGIFNGLIMMLAMVVSPFFALSLAEGSFDGLTKGMSTAATVAVTAGAGAMAAAGGIAAGGLGRGMSAAGGGLQGLGGVIGGGGGIGFQGAGAMSRMQKAIGSGMSATGKVMKSGGGTLSKAGAAVRSGGSDFAANTIRKGLKLDKPKSGGGKISRAPEPFPEKQVTVEGLHSSAPSAGRRIGSSGGQDSNSGDKS